MKKIWMVVGLVLLVSVAYCGTVNAEERVIRVGVHPLPPMSMIDGGEFSGFDVDLWREIAREQGIKYSFVAVPRFEDYWTLLRNDEIDIALSGVSMTAALENEFDFTHNYFKSGMRILMLREALAYENSGRLFSPSRVFRKIGLLFSRFVEPDVVDLLCIVFLSLLFWGHLIYLAERGKMVPKNYLLGISDAIWFTMTSKTTAGFGDLFPKCLQGRFVTGLIFLVGIVLITDYTSTVTAKKIEEATFTPRNLVGRIVAAKEGSAGILLMKEYGARIKTVAAIEEGYNLLLQRKVDAVVFDNPSVLFFANTQGAGQVRVAGELFAEQYYSICMREGDYGLREAINRGLMKTFNSPMRKELKEKWFGAYKY